MIQNIEEKNSIDISTFVVQYKAFLLIQLVIYNFILINYQVIALLFNLILS